MDTLRVSEPHELDPPAVRDPAVTVRDLGVRYGAKVVLKGVDIDAERHSVLALVGPSGSGKTTLLRSLNRLVELAPGSVVTGSVLLDGEEVYSAGRDLNLLRRRVGMVFQQPNPFPMTIFENVAFALREQARRRPRRSQLEGPVQQVLQHAGLWDEVKDGLHGSALALSGGQQQRLCIARALAADPEVLLMDEPCSALDPRSTAIIEDLIRRLKDEMTVVIVTHNLGQARRISDRLGFTLNGELLEEGPTERLFTAPERDETRGYLAGSFG